MDNPPVSNILPIRARYRYGTSRQSRRMPISSILPHPNIPIGVVPLAPSQTGTGTLPPPGTTGAELNSHRPSASPASEDINTLPVETVQRIIKETLQQMGVGQIQVEVGQSNPTHRRRHRSTIKTQQLVKEQQNRMSLETDVDWKVRLVSTY